MSGASRKRCLVAGLVALVVLLLAGGCTSVREVRIENVSTHDFEDVRIGEQSFGDVAAGTTSGYLPVELRFRYATITFRVDGTRVTGQTLNFGAQRFTWQIDVVDREAGQLAIEVVGE